MNHIVFRHVRKPVENGQFEGASISAQWLNLKKKKSLPWPVAQSQKKKKSQLSRASDLKKKRGRPRATQLRQKSIRIASCCFRICRCIFQDSLSLFGSCFSWMDLCPQEAAFHCCRCLHCTMQRCIRTLPIIDGLSCDNQGQRRCLGT